MQFFVSQLTIRCPNQNKTDEYIVRKHAGREYIFRSRGDSKRPLIVLTVSGGVNVLLNMLFVIVFKMNVVGVALGYSALPAAETIIGRSIDFAIKRDFGF